ncbi:hypothetical protein AJ87_03115 [Rhizobium yanglingense]|nr:hypothetical protein AJ87_03115 [Rhizobium yanglingense]
MSEERRRPKHVPTPDEKAEYERLIAKRAKDRNRGIWSFGRIEPWPEFDIIYTGKLTLAYEGGWSHGLRKSWSDGKSQTVETILGDFVTGMRMIITAEAENIRIRAGTERRRQALSQRRELATRRADREDKRLSYLQWIAAHRREIDDLRATISAVPKAANLPPEYERMISWAEQRLSELEARTTVDQIQASLVDQNLYPSLMTSSIRTANHRRSKTTGTIERDVCGSAGLYHR